MTGNLKRLQITQPVELVDAIRKQMDRDGETNLSAWLGEVARKKIDKDIRPPRGRPGWGGDRKSDLAQITE